MSASGAAKGSQAGPGAVRMLVFMIGFVAMAAQIVLMREVLVVFQGNELSLGVGLAAWLIWTSLGSALAGARFTARLPPYGFMLGLLVAFALAFPFTILLVRMLRALVQETPGEAFGPVALLWYPAATLGVFCLISGGLFCAGSRLLIHVSGVETAASTGTVYQFESFGGAAGGMIAGLVLVHHASAFLIAFCLDAALLLPSVWFLIESSLVRRLAVALLVCVAAALLVGRVDRDLEGGAYAGLWPGYRVEETVDSVFGRLTVVSTDFTRTLLHNGLALFTAPDEATAEELVHLALLEHPRPIRLLLVGGGAAGGLSQALRHSTLQRVDYVELDPTIPELAARRFPEIWTDAVRDPRVAVLQADGRLFLKRPGTLYDVIILSLPDPQTAQLNRFFTLEFYREAAARLNPDGLLSFQANASENYIGADLAEFLRCLHKTLREVFPEVAAIPGGRIHFMAALRKGALTLDPHVLTQRLKERRLRTAYVREYYLPFRMSPERLEDLQRQIQPRPETRVNRDFTPVAYYFNTVLWTSQFQSSYAVLFKQLAQVRLSDLATALVVLSILVGALSKARVRPLFSEQLTRKLKRLPSERPRPDFYAYASMLRVGAGLAVAVMGFLLMTLQIYLMLGFQSLFGYLYIQLALLMAAFMLGMGLGSWWSLRSGGGPLRLLRLQAGAAACPLLLCAVLSGLGAVVGGAPTTLVSHLVFPLLALLAGVMGGYQFPLASRIYFGLGLTGLFQSPRRSATAQACVVPCSDHSDSQKTPHDAVAPQADEAPGPAKGGGEHEGSGGRQRSDPGVLYALDLVGAFFGSALLSLYLVPVFGFWGSACLASLLALLPVAVLAGCVHREWRPTLRKL